MGQRPYEGRSFLWELMRACKGEIKASCGFLRVLEELPRVFGRPARVGRVCKGVWRVSEGVARVFDGVERASMAAKKAPEAATRASGAVGSNKNKLNNAQ